MGDTNYFSGIVKVLENPKHSLIIKDVSIINFRAEIPQNRANKIISLIFWGNLATEVQNYYQINDYILVEGYLSSRIKKSSSNKLNNFRQITLTVLKVYPLLIKIDQ